MVTTFDQQRISG